MSKTKARPQDTIALEPVKFWEIVQCGIRAGQEIAPAVSPQLASESDSPWQKAANAIADILVNEPETFDPAMARFQALIDLYVRDVLTKWTRSASRESGDGAHVRGGDDIHPAVIDIAATMRLSPNGRFPSGKFLKQVEENIEKNYKDYGGWPMKSPQA